MAATIFVLFLICIAAIASSRSRYWNAVLGRLWMIASVVWIVGARLILDRDGAVDWNIVILPPPGVLVAFGVLHWAFSPHLPTDPPRQSGMWYWFKRGYHEGRARPYWPRTSASSELGDGKRG